MDTGAAANCIPIGIVKSLKMIPTKNKNDLKDLVLVDYNKNKIKTFGLASIKCIDLKAKIENIITFVVVDDNCTPILGLKSCVDLGLINRADINKISLPDTSLTFIEQYRDVFNGLGKFPGESKIFLKPDSQPKLHYRKRFPQSLMVKLQNELKRMVKDEIISPVSYPTDWVNNLQVVEKSNGTLRLCLDPKPLNDCIRREYFLIPTIDDLTSSLTDAKVFTVIDLTCGFWHISLDKKSSDLTTFMTPFGRYKFNRLPFGLNCAPEIFQRRMVQLFGDIAGVHVYFDDIMIAASSYEEHDEIMDLIMKRAREFNVKFNKEKIQYRQKSVKLWETTFHAILSKLVVSIQKLFYKCHGQEVRLKFCVFLVYLSI